MKKTGMGLVIPKTLRFGGVTFYQRGEQLWLYTAEQRPEDVIPRVRFSRRMVSRQEMNAVEGVESLFIQEKAIIESR